MIGEGRNLLFEDSVVVSVAWFGTFEIGTYKITHAFKVPLEDQKTFRDYPFVHSAKDKKVVAKIIQSNCEHDWQYFNYHVVCLLCHIEITADYREKVLELEGVEAIDLNDDYIIAQYGPSGLALRRGRANVDEEKTFR